MALPDNELIHRQVTTALAEDVGSGDLTASLVSATAQCHARVIVREAAVICGTAWFDEVMRQVDQDLEVTWHCQDGDQVEADMLVCEIVGNAASVLTAERSALNFLQTLSAVATKTAYYVGLVHGTKANILDTRKTIPGLRLAQKYAVLCGGGVNHRIGLYDAILIKENHIAAAGSVTAALEAAFKLHPGVETEIEIETLMQLEEALAAGAKRILLDNLSNDELQQAVAINKGRARLEASGGVDDTTVRNIAETGVDDISIGGLTKDLKATDFSMRFDDLAVSTKSL